MIEGAQPPLDPGWVDDVLLAGRPGDTCLVLGAPVNRQSLRGLVADHQESLAAAGLRDRGVVALCLPPSLTFISTLLAAWRIGAQAILLDHRLTPYEVDRALSRLAPEVVVRAKQAPDGTLRGFADVEAQVSSRPGLPAAGPHALVQLSSGSTGPSKVIGRTAADLIPSASPWTRS